MKLLDLLVPRPKDFPPSSDEEHLLSKAAPCPWHGGSLPKQPLGPSQLSQSGGCLATCLHLPVMEESGIALHFPAFSLWLCHSCSAYNLDRLGNLEYFKLYLISVSSHNCDFNSSGPKPPCCDFAKRSGLILLCL